MFMGMDGFDWFVGVVEDRMDPLKLGRMKVRMAALHPEKKGSVQGISTSDLKWCHPLTTIFDAAMNGIGRSPLGVVEGTWVWGFFRDSLKQEAIVVGTLPGIPSEAPNGSRGFYDPNEQYPRVSHLNEPDTNRLSRNDVDPNDYNETKSVDDFQRGETPYVYRPHEIIAKKRAAEEKSIPIAAYRSNNEVYDELKTPYNASYPFNHVCESESGHVHEIDDTEGSERLHTYHRTGSFDEIHADGSHVEKIVGDDYEIVVKDKNAFIKGNLNITVVGDATMYIQGNTRQQVDGNVESQVKGNVDYYIEGNVTGEVNGTVDQTIHGNVIQEVDGNVNQTIHGGQGLTQTVDNTVTINCRDYILNASSSIKTSTNSHEETANNHKTLATSISRDGLTINDAGGGATLDLQGIASLDGITIHLG